VKLWSINHLPLIDEWSVIDLSLEVFWTSAGIYDSHCDNLVLKEGMKDVELAWMAYRDLNAAS